MAIKVTSVYNLLKKRFDRIPFEGAWLEAFDQPEKRGTWFISGRSTNGKTSFCLQLVKQLASLGLKTLYFALEEGNTLTFQKSIIRTNWADVAGNIQVVERFTPFSDVLEGLAEKRVKVVVVDTVQRWDLTDLKDYITLKDRYPNILFIFVSHVKDNGMPDGRIANLIHQDADLKIWVEGYRAISKGRLVGDLGYYNIWEEGANKYWLDKI